MSIYLGSNKINSLYFGSQKIGSIYLGGQKVYSSAPAIPYVTIGNQTWMSKNLAIDDGNGGIYTQTVNYGQGSVTEYYYTWVAALRVAASVQGWHLPTRAEWDTLASTVGSGPGTKLKSTYGWSSGNGTDNYGFTGLPAGRRSTSSFVNFGSYAYFWTADQYYTSSDAYYRRLTYNKKIVYSSSCDQTSYYHTVRLVKDS